ncbi:MAG: tyrosine-type recombinase/integrase [Agitococcus sp.]|nr:tyrosine-type recombinase/integrase [Agitococcus sp.]MDO9177016.1 tyrosine-type recombinase/integrase [Agitococcus sp.]
MFLRDARPDCDALPSEQLLLLAQAAPSLVRGWKGLRLAAMLAVLRETGLRNNEVLTLSQSSITFGPPAMLHVGCPPTSRFFHLSDFCAERLCMWLAAHPCKTRTELLFVANEYGGTLDTSTVWRQINRLSTKVLGIEIRGMGVGRIRASVAKQLQDEGASAVEIQYFLGHKQETSTAELLDRIHVGGFDA